MLIGPAMLVALEIVISAMLLALPKVKPVTPLEIAKPLVKLSGLLKLLLIVLGAMVTVPVVSNTPPEKYTESASTSILLVDAVTGVAASLPTVPYTSTPEAEAPLLAPAPCNEIRPLFAKTFEFVATTTPAFLAPVPFNVIPPPPVAKMEAVQV